MTSGRPPREKKTVAVKSADVPDNRRLDILREALIHCRIDHPHIVKLIGTCTTKMPFLIVLEYMELGSLENFLKLRRPDRVSGREMATVLVQVASAMKYLAAERIIHRDLASRNVL